MQMLLYQQQISILISHYNSQKLFIMICSYCQPKQPSLAKLYNIELVRQRFIPTYYHTQILAPADIEKHQRVWCTPTFHSQIMNTNRQGQEKKKTINYIYQKIAESGKQVAYKNQSIGRMQEQFYNKKGKCCYRSNDLRCDNNKQDFLKKLECCCRDNYAHNRKQIDLGSNPVFGGGFVEISFSPPDIQQFPVPPAANLIPTDKFQKDQQPLQYPIIEQKESAIQTVNIDQPKEYVYQQSHQQQSNNNKRQNIIAEKKTLKKGSAFNRTIVQGWPTFTIVLKRDW